MERNRMLTSGFATPIIGGMLECEERAEQIVRTVERWSEEHPRKTRQSEFLKQWPNATVIDDYLRICPRDLTGDTSNCGKTLCSNCKRKYWLQEVE